MTLSAEEILSVLHEVHDPELPGISVVELGVVRAVRPGGSNVEVDITPTYSGCPALKLMEEEIVQCLKEQGFSSVKVNIIYAPAWSSEWISAEARRKLKSLGIAPPQTGGENLVQFPAPRKEVACPLCNSGDTVCRSEYGATSCKAIYYCNSCAQPFEYFKDF